MKKLLVLATILCGAFHVLADGFDGKTLATNDWFDASFTALTVDSEVVLNSTTGIVYGTGAWTSVPTNGTAKIVADADAGGGATMLSFETGDEELEFTPAPLSSPTGMETTSTTVKGGAVSELPTAPGNVQAGFTVYDDGTNAVPYGLTSGGWTNLVYSGAMSGLTNAWYTLTLDFANVANVRYVRYAVTPAGGSRTVLEDSLGTTWFPAASNATTITSVAFTGTGDIRSFGADSLADAVATCNGVNYNNIADAIAGASEGDTITLLKKSAEAAFTVGKNITIDLAGMTTEIPYIMIAPGKTLTLKRANRSNEIGYFTGGGNLVIAGNNTFRWDSMSGTTTLASITQEDSSGGITISGHGTINVTSNVIVNAVLTFAPASADAAYVSDGFTIKMTANSIAAGTLNGGATIETAEGTTVGAGTFYGVFAAGGVSATGSFTSQGANALAGTVSVAAGKTLAIGSRLGSMSNIRFHLDATDSTSYDLYEGTDNLSRIKGGNYNYPLVSGTTAAVLMDGDENHFGGKPYFQFSDSRYTYGNKVAAWSYIAVTQPNALSGYLARYSDQDRLGLNSSGWYARCFSKNYDSLIYQNGLANNRGVTTDTDVIVSLPHAIVASDNRADTLGTEFNGAIAEFIGFYSTISLEDRAACEMPLMNKWNLACAANFRPFVSTAKVEVDTGATLDMGGYTNTVASFTGGGTVQNGLLLTTDNVYTNTGALTIPAVHEMTVVLDAGASALTLVGDATNVSVTATDAFIESGATITITALGIHDAGHTIDFSGIPSDIFRFGYNDNGDGTWTLGAQTSGFTAATYVWSPTSTTNWTSLANWKVGGKAVAVLPQSVDTVVFPDENVPENGWGVVLDEQQTVAAVQAAGDVTLAGARIQVCDPDSETAAVSGAGTITLGDSAGFFAGEDADMKLTLAANMKISASGDHVAQIKGRSSGAGSGGASIKINGNLTGNGYLEIGGSRASVVFGGANADFYGSVTVLDDYSRLKAHRTTVQFASPEASSSNAAWNIVYNYNDTVLGQVGSNKVYYFGELTGEVDNSKAALRAASTIEIGAKNTDFGLVFKSINHADRRDTIVKRGTGTMTMLSGTKDIGTYNIAAGTLFVTATEGMPHNAFVFSGGTLKTGYEMVEEEAVPLDPSALIKNSTSAIVFDDQGTNSTWATALDISNTGGLVKKGEGTLTLKEVPQYKGDTYLDGGTLKIPTAAGVKVKTHAIDMRIQKFSETIDNVEYTVYKLIEIKPGTLVILT